MLALSEGFECMCVCFFVCVCMYACVWKSGRGLCPSLVHFQICDYSISILWCWSVSGYWIIGSLWLLAGWLAVWGLTVDISILYNWPSSLDCPAVPEASSRCLADAHSSRAPPPPPNGLPWLPCEGLMINPYFAALAQGSLQWYCGPECWFYMYWKCEKLTYSNAMTDLLRRVCLW